MTSWHPPNSPTKSAGWALYRVLKVLGAGGMGVVFQAEDTLLQRQVALKAILPCLAANPATRQRYLREARAAAGLEHDNIVLIYKVGEDCGVPFIAMPLLKGETLKDRLGASPGCRWLYCCDSAGKSRRAWPVPTSAAWSIATSSPPICGWKKAAAGSRSSTSAWLVAPLITPRPRSSASPPPAPFPTTPS